MPFSSTARCIFVLSPFWAGHALVPALRARSVGMHLDASRVFHQPLHLGAVAQDFEQPLPHALVAPAAEAHIDAAPLAEIRRQVAPVRKTQNTALTKRRLSLAIPPHCPRRPGSMPSMSAHFSSEMSCLRCVASMFSLHAASIIPRIFCLVNSCEQRLVSF